LTPVEIPDQRIQTPPPAARTGIASGAVVSLMLHALAALLLAGGFDGHEAPKSVEAVEVELVTLAEPVQPEPLPVPDEQEAAFEPEDETPPEPEAKTAVEPEPETPPAEPEETPATPEIPVLQPVLEFGDEDTAPEFSEQGEPQQAEGPQDEEEPQEAAETVETPAAEAETPVEDAAPEPEGADPQEAQDLAQDPAPEEGSPADPAAEDGPEPEPLQAETAAAADPVEIGPSDEPEKLPVAPEASEQTAPATAPEDAPAAEENENGNSVLGDTLIAAVPRSKPPASRRPAAPSGGNNGGAAPGAPVGRILTGDVLPDSRMRTAMRSMTSGQRLNLLCLTELQAQLNASTPPYLPDIMPSLRPREGTVLAPAGWVAFRTFGQWFDVTFRCETDPEVRRVEHFSFKVGGLVPRSQWHARGFPM